MTNDRELPNRPASNNRNSSNNGNAGRPPARPGGPNAAKLDPTQLAANRLTTPAARSSRTPAANADAATAQQRADRQGASASLQSPPQDARPTTTRPMSAKRAAVSLRRRTFKLITDWRFLTLVGLSLTGGLTALSIAFLFKLPVLPNCPSVFWPLASGSMRLHCAQLAAGKETVPDLLEAIALMNTLKSDHPLYPEAARLIEQWSTTILDLAEKDFQAGKLKQAIASAKQIPSNSAAAKLVDERVKTWEKIWGDAEKIYNRAGEILKKGNWRDAQVESARLLSIDNNYWQTTKYQELGTLIVATREDITKLGKADNALSSGRVDDLVAAIQEVSSIGEKSFVHKDAKEMLPKLGRKMFDLAQNALDRKDYNAALDIANRIPGNVGLGNEVDDFRTIASAQSKAWSGGVLNLEEAIADAQRIAKGRPLYDKAQRLITGWQAEAQEVAKLDQAKKLAQAGDLQNAIAQASQLSNSQAAKDFVQQTTGQIQESQDRPILDQASKIAMGGDESSLETAIAQAKQIGAGRSLHAQAKEKIRQWSDQIKQLRNQAAEAARPTPPSPAVSTTQPVGPQPSEQAPAVNNSPDNTAEQSILEQARNVAGSGTPDGLLQAIGIAQSLPTNSPLRNEATTAVDQWSNQLVQVAQYQSEFDILGAINIANRVPPSSSAYPQAQELISKWRKSVGQP